MGIITMLFGALLVIAPGAGAAGNGFRDECRAILGVSADTVVYGAKWQWTGASSVAVAQNESLNGLTALMGWEPFDGDDADAIADDGTTFTFSEASKLVFKAGVKQANDALFIYDVDPDATSGTFDFTNVAGNNVFSHVTLCGYTPDDPSLTVTKDIDSQDEDLLDDEFPVDIDGTNGTDDDLTDDESLDVLNAEGEYTITETVPAEGWQAPSLDCGAGDVTPDAEGVWTVTVGETDVSCVLTNTPEAPRGTGDLVVSKVAGANAPGTSPTFTFTVDCTVGEEAIDLNGEDPGFTATFNLLFGESESFDDLHEDATCDVVETIVGGASSTSVSVNGGAGSNGTSASDVAITPGQTPATVAFTNNYPGGGCTSNCGPPPPPPPPIVEVEPANLTVAKTVTGEVPEDGWSFSFNNDVLGDFDLTNEDDSTSDEVDAGEYTITEDASDDADLVSIECTGTDDEVVDLDAGTVSVTLEEGDSVSCTFTNDFPEVEGEVITPPKEEPAPAVAPTEVKGSQVVRQLPRTGSSSQTLATVGAMLILFGAVITLGSRRKLQLEQ